MKNLLAVFILFMFCDMETNAMNDKYRYKRRPLIRPASLRECIIPEEMKPPLSFSPNFLLGEVNFYKINVFIAVCANNKIKYLSLIEFARFRFSGKNDCEGYVGINEGLYECVDEEKGNYIGSIKLLDNLILTSTLNEEQFFNNILQAITGEQYGRITYAELFKNNIFQARTGELYKFIVSQGSISKKKFKEDYCSFFPRDPSHEHYKK